MKIIKKGKIRKEEWRGSCLDCHCEFMYDRNDIKIDQREGDYVVCPTCGKFINVMGRYHADKDQRCIITGFLKKADE